MRGVVRTSINAAWFFQVRAEIARSRFLLDRCFLVSGPLRIVNHHFEWVQINIAVRAILRAKAAANAPILDDNFERIASSNRANGAANHTERVAALAAARGDKILIEAQAVAHEASDAVVRVRASIHASITARTILQIENQEALRFHQALR